MPNLNIKWSELLVEELIRCECKVFFVAPGSRSTPIVAALSKNNRAKVIVSYDERSAGFAAVGYARATRNPAAVVVTSGTAVANLYPAVVEASIDHIPMVLLTADRPAVARDTGSNQTIDQVKIFGDYVRWQNSLSPTDTATAPQLLSTVDYLVAQSYYPLPGPVQLNCMFDEPLAPIVKSYEFAEPELWRTSAKPWTTYVYPRSIVEPSKISQVAEAISRCESGLVVLGALSQNVDSAEFLRFLEMLNWPVYADIRSGFRLNPVVENDYFFDGSRQYDLILQFGGRLVLKPIQTFLANNKAKRYIFIDQYSQRLDPQFSVTDRIVADIDEFVKSLSESICHIGENNRHSRAGGNPGQLPRPWFPASAGMTTTISEPFVARSISQNIPSNSGLFLSASMPIRDMDKFAVASKKIIKIEANRGASGIDGIISSACGFALGLNQPTTLAVGDMAFLHDMNGLSILRSISVPLTIVLINNQGGGIFSFLPIGDFPAVLTPYIDSPHEFDFEKLCAGFCVSYIKVKTCSEFDAAYFKSVNGQRHTIIEVVSDKVANVTLHNQIDAAKSRHAY